MYLIGNKLFCKNADAGNLITEFRPIAPHRFVLDDNAHVEFVQVSFGRWSHISSMLVTAMSVRSGEKNGTNSLVLPNRGNGCDARLTFVPNF
jgi:hypothetical protein